MFTTELYPLASLSFTLLTWQSRGSGMDAPTDPDDEAAPPTSQGEQEYLTEDEYNRYANIIIW